MCLQRNRSISHYKIRCTFLQNKIFKPLHTFPHGYDITKHNKNVNCRLWYICLSPLVHIFIYLTTGQNINKTPLTHIYEYLHQFFKILKMNENTIWICSRKSLFTQEVLIEKYSTSLCSRILISNNKLSSKQINSKK